MNTIQSTSYSFVTPDFNSMFQNMGLPVVASPTANPMDYERRFAEFMAMDDEDKQDYYQTLVSESAAGTISDGFLCYLMAKMGEDCPRIAAEKARKAKQKKTIIFVVIMLLVLFAAWYFLFRK